MIIKGKRLLKNMKELKVLVITQISSLYLINRSQPLL